MSDNLVVVLSRNYSTGLSVIRSLGEAGYTVDLIASALREGRSLAISKSRYLRNTAEVVSQKVDSGKDEELLARLLEYKDKYSEKPVLIPTDDYTASVMDENRQALEEIFLMPGIAGEGERLTKYMDKSIQCRIAEDMGMPAPACWVVSLRERPVKIPDEVTYPCFIKPLESFTGYKQEMAKCEDKEQLQEHLDKLSESFSERDFLIQEYIDIDNEIDIEGVAMDQEVILPGVVWKSIVAGYDRGVPLAGEFMPFDRFPGLKEQVEELIREYHYTGMFDLGINLVGEKYYFNEMNLRSGGTNFVYFKSGVNLADLFVKHMKGIPCGEDELTPEFGKTYFYEKMGYEDLLHEILTKETFDEWDQKADIKFFVNEEDPEPGEIFTEEQEKRIKRKARREELYARVMEETGMSREDAEGAVAQTKEKIGAGLRDYVRYRLWEVAPEDLEEEYKKRVERRQRRLEQRESCINAVSEAKGIQREEALEMIRDARSRIGISFRDYEKFSFWEISPDDQQAQYDKIKERREKRRQQREECITSSMEDMGWSRQEAEEKLADARSRLDISFKDYAKHAFWKLSEEQQVKEYQNIQEKKERQRLRKEECIAEAMNEMGWSRQEAEEKIKDARKRLGVSYNDYRKHHFCRMSDEKQKLYYDKILSKKK